MFESTRRGFFHHLGGILGLPAALKTLPGAEYDNIGYGGAKAARIGKSMFRVESDNLTLRWSNDDGEWPTLNYVTLFRPIMGICPNLDELLVVLTTGEVYRFHRWHISEYATLEIVYRGL